MYILLDLNVAARCLTNSQGCLGLFTDLTTIFLVPSACNFPVLLTFTEYVIDINQKQS